METTFELIPKSTAEKLDAHKKSIRIGIDGNRKGAAEQFGYAFIAGCRLLQARSDISNGNSHSSDAGFEKWVAANFTDLQLRTARNWMLFADSVKVTAASIDGFKNSPLLLGAAKLNVKTRLQILTIVPRVMDGKGMMKFMRDTQLLLDPEKQKHHGRTKVSSQEAANARCKQAKRMWDRIEADLDNAGKIVKRIEDKTDLQRYLDALVDAGNKIREELKTRKEK